MQAEPYEAARAVLLVRALGRDRALVLAFAAWALAALALAIRIPFGVGMTDEAFYSAMPYGFLLGNEPYRDELAFHQNAAILQMPLFRVYMWLFDSEGIVVFSRWLYGAYVGLCSFFAFRLARRLSSAAAGAWAAALVVSFSYYNLFTLSYNTLGALGMLGGVLLGTHAVLEKPVRHLVGAWFFFITGAFAYPTFGVIVLLHQASMLWLLRSSAEAAEFKRSALAVAVCAIVAAVAAALFLYWVTPAGIARALEFSRAMGYGSRTLKVAVFKSEIWAQRNYLAAYGLVFILFPIALERWRRGALPLALLVPAALALIYWRSGHVFNVSRAAILLTAAPLLVPVCLLRSPRFAHRRLLLLGLWLPAVVSFEIASFTSANGALSAHLGALPILVSSVVALDALIREPTLSLERVDAGKWALVGFSAGVLGCQIHTMFSGVYDRETRLGAQTTRVRRGPMRGAVTTPRRARLLEGIDADLKRIEDPSKTLAVFDDFSVAYLSTHMRPRTFTHWVVWVFERNYARKITAKYYGDPATQPDFVVLVPANLSKHDKFLNYLWSYEPFIQRPELGYLIAKRVPKMPPPLGQ